MWKKPNGLYIEVIFGAASCFTVDNIEGRTLLYFFSEMLEDSIFIHSSSTTTSGWRSWFLHKIAMKPFLWRMFGGGGRKKEREGVHFEAACRGNYVHVVPVLSLINKHILIYWLQKKVRSSKVPKRGKKRWQQLQDC